MKVTTNGDTAELEIETYSDLLRIRALPEWHMIGPRIARTDKRLLHIIEAATADETTSWDLLSSFLFDYQRWIVELALDRRRFAVFSTTGTGKTAVQLEWARLVTGQHGGRTLITAPHAIIPQTIEEAAKFYGDSLTVADLRERSALNSWLSDGTGIGITNHEKLDGATEPLPVRAVVIDESSVLKHSMGARRSAIIAAFRGVPWKLACSATPAPNDRVEYAEHAYFLDVVRSTREFLAAYFVNRDGGWQLKAHGEDAFYRHLASWSVFMRSPAAYGFSDASDKLPPLDTEYPAVTLTPEQAVAAREWEKGDPSLFGATPGGVTSRIKMMQIGHGFELDGDKGPIRRLPSHKPDAIARIVNEDHPAEQVIMWVTFDEEGEQLARLIPGSVHLSGKTKQAERERVIAGFRTGAEPRVLLLKPRMFGYGLNLQACSVQVFSTITDSFEAWSRPRSLTADRLARDEGMGEGGTRTVQAVQCDGPLGAVAWADGY